MVVVVVVVVVVVASSGILQTTMSAKDASQALARKSNRLLGSDCSGTAAAADTHGPTGKVVCFQPAVAVKMEVDASFMS